MWKMLIIDDEEKWINQVEKWFKPKGYQVLRAFSGEKGVEMAKQEKPDIVILDLALNGMQGEDVLTELQHDETTVDIPIAVFSMKGDDRVRRLRIAHEGIVPIVKKEEHRETTVMAASKWDLMELEIVVEHLIMQREKLRPKSRSDRIQVGDYELRLGEGCIEVWVNDEHKRLAPLEAGVLAYLNDQRGQPCNVKEIADRVWRDRRTVGDENRVRRIIERLREKIEPDGSNPIFIVTVKGFGYKLTEGDK